jgi:integrase/recombinase XerD
MEFVNEALNHSDMKTTKGYFAGFADETKKEFSEALMKF